MGGPNFKGSKSLDRDDEETAATDDEEEEDGTKKEDDEEKEDVAEAVEMADTTRLTAPLDGGDNDDPQPPVCGGCSRCFVARFSSPTRLAALRVSAKPLL